MFFFAFASVVRTSTPRKVAALTSCVVSTLRSQPLLSTCCHFPSRTSSLLYPSISLRPPLFPHLTPLGPNPCLFSTAPVPVNTRDHSDELKSLIERVRSAEKQPRSQRRQFLEEIDLRAPALLALGTRSELVGWLHARSQFELSQKSRGALQQVLVSQGQQGFSAMGHNALVLSAISLSRFQRKNFSVPPSALSALDRRFQELMPQFPVVDLVQFVYYRYIVDEMPPSLVPSLVAATSQRRLSPQTVAHLLIRFRACPSAALPADYLSWLETQLVETAAQLTPIAASTSLNNIICQNSSTPYAPSPRFYQAIESALLRLAPDLQVRDLINVVGGLGKASHIHTPSVACMQKLDQLALASLPSFTASDISIYLLGRSQIDLPAPQQLLDLLVDRLCQKDFLANLPPFRIGFTILGMAKLNPSSPAFKTGVKSDVKSDHQEDTPETHRLHQKARLAQAIAQQCEKRIKDSSFQQLALILHSLENYIDQPSLIPLSLMQRLDKLPAELVLSAKISDIGLFLRALSNLGSVFTPSQSLLASLENAAFKNLKHAREAEITNILLGFSRFLATHKPAIETFHLFCALLAEPSFRFNKTETKNVLHSLSLWAELETYPPKALLQTLVLPLKDNLPSYPLAQLFSVTNALSKFYPHYEPPAAVLKALEAAYSDKLDQIGDAYLTGDLKQLALCSKKHAYSPAFVQACDQRLSTVVPTSTVQDSIRALYFLARACDPSGPTPKTLPILYQDLSSRCHEIYTDNLPTIIWSLAHFHDRSSPPSLLLQSLEKMILDKADTFNSMHISMILRSFSLLSAVHSPSADFFLKLGERSLEIIDEFTGDQAYVALSALPSPQH